MLVSFQKVTEQQGQDSAFWVSVPTTQLPTFAALWLVTGVFGKSLLCLGIMWHTENEAQELDRQEGVFPWKHLVPVASVLCELAYGPEHLCALESFQENRFHKINMRTGSLLTYAELKSLKCSAQWLCSHVGYHSHYYGFHLKSRVDQGPVIWEHQVKVIVIGPENLWNGSGSGLGQYMTLVSKQRQNCVPTS